MLLFYLLKKSWINCVEFEFFLGLFMISKLRKALKLFQLSSPRLAKTTYIWNLVFTCMNCSCADPLSFIFWSSVFAFDFSCFWCSIMCVGDSLTCSSCMFTFSNFAFKSSRSSKKDRMGKMGHKQHLTIKDHKMKMIDKYVNKGLNQHHFALWHLKLVWCLACPTKHH